MKNFADKKVLITGGASGIGKLMAEKLASRGAIVIVADINFESAESLVSNIKRTGGKAYAVHADLTDLASLKKCKSVLHAQDLHIDILEIQHRSRPWQTAR